MPRRPPPRRPARSRAPGEDRTPPRPPERSRAGADARSTRRPERSHGAADTRPPRRPGRSHGAADARPSRHEERPRAAADARSPRRPERSHGGADARPPRRPERPRQPAETRATRHAPAPYAAPPPRAAAPPPVAAAPPPPRDHGPWLYGRHAVAAALANPVRRVRRLVASQEAAAELRTLAAGAAARLPPGAPEVLDRHGLDLLLPQGAVHQGMALAAEPLPARDIDDVLDGISEATGRRSSYCSTR